MRGFAYDLAGNRIKKMDLTPGGVVGNSRDCSLPDGMDVTIPSGVFTPGFSDSSGKNCAYWHYDGFGQLLESNDPDKGVEEFGYNAFGDVTSATDGNGRETTMTYDSLGRLSTKTLPDNEGTVTYDYDRLNGSQNAIGKMVSIDDPSQVKLFSYDRLGRINRETRMIKNTTTSGTFSTTFEYDLLNRKRVINYPVDPKTGVSITARYRFGSMGTTAVEIFNKTGRKEIIKNITYNEFGQMTKIERGNGTVTDYKYDIKGRLDNLVTKTNSNETTHELQHVDYTFRVDNSIASVENKPNIDCTGAYQSAVTYNYKYDGLNRLVSADGTYTRNATTVNRFEHGYSYAENGNMTAKTIYDPDTHSVSLARSYDYYDINTLQSNHAVKEVTSTDGSSIEMTYDAAGNMTQQIDSAKGTKKMAYDSYNRIAKVTDANNSLVGQYWYDDQGFRVRKISKKTVNNQERTVEVLYPSMYFGIEKQTAGSQESSYAVNNIYLDGVRIAAVIPNGEARYYLTDQVDSVKVVVDDRGNAVSRMEYLPYGETWFQENKGDPTPAELHKPKYNSQELDEETGYYFYNARHYDAGVSRFITPDSVIDGEYDTQGWNRYAYCSNNPIIYRDPTGHTPEGKAAGEEASQYIPGVDKELGGMIGDKVSDMWNSLFPSGDEGTQNNDVAKKAEGIKDNKGTTNDKKPDFTSPLDGLTKDDLKSTQEGGKISSGFGPRKDPITKEDNGKHYGIDLKAGNNTPIKAMAGGQIRFDENNPTGKDEKGKDAKGWGYFAEIDHGNGYKTLYAHMNKEDWEAAKTKYSGEEYKNQVKQNDIIGGVGNSGGSTGNHLHLEIKKDDVAIDPKNYLEQAISKE